MPPKPWFWTEVAVEATATEVFGSKISKELWKVSWMDTVACSTSVGELLFPRALMFSGNLSLAASSPKTLGAELGAELEAGIRHRSLWGIWALMGRMIGASW